MNLNLLKKPLPYREKYPSEEAASVKSNQEKQRDRHGYPREKRDLLHGPAVLHAIRSSVKLRAKGWDSASLILSLKIDIS